MNHLAVAESRLDVADEIDEPGSKIRLELLALYQEGRPATVEGEKA